MADTKALVAAILLKDETLSRAGGPESVHTLITRCQNKLFSKPCNNSIYIDPLTGRHPFLPVTGDKFDYDIPPVQITIDGIARDIEFSRCVEIFILDEDAEDYGLLETITNWEKRKWIEKQEDRYILPVHSYDRIDNTRARIIFQNAPENTEAELYRHVSLIRPLPVTDDAIPLMVNERWYEALIDGVLGMAEYHNYGRSDRLQTFNDYWCNLFWESSDIMPRANKVTSTPPRRF